MIGHGTRFLTAVPQYGTDLERMRAEVQREWLAVSDNGTSSVARENGRYIHVDQPDVVLEAIRRVVSQIEDDDRPSA